MSSYSNLCVVTILFFTYFVFICLSAPSSAIDDLPDAGEDLEKPQNDNLKFFVVYRIRLNFWWVLFDVFPENNFTCYHVKCPKGAVACKRLQTTSKDGSNLITEVECQDEHGKEGL